MKLYRVNLKGMKDGMGTIYGMPYVVANDSAEALKKVQEYIQKRDLGFECEREMESIELLAEEGDYPKCGVQLYL